MTGLEALAVISCVAAVVSAFNAGHAIVRTLKVKRQATRARTPSKYLEESLAAGPVAVEAEKQAGVDKFGEAFGRGDGERP